MINLEFCYRALLGKLDGTTSGPNSFKGQSWIIFHLSDLIRLIQKSQFPSLYQQIFLLTKVSFLLTVIYWKLGTLCHSHWLTMGTRVLVEYIRTENPSAELQTLAKHGIQVYASSWFNINIMVQWSQQSFLHHEECPNRARDLKLRLKP